MPFEDKVVVITGSGTGIGRALVAGFCRDGAHVVGIGRTEADLAATAREHGQGRMHFVVGDVSRAADVERLFAAAEERHGRVDVLVNNAAIYPKRAFLEASVEEWLHTLDVNVGGMARCCHRALPGMLERGFGRVLNVGSFAWQNPIPTASDYSASKAAVRVLTQGIAREIDRYRFPDVLVNEWLPGIFNTRMSPDAGGDPMTAYAGARVVASLAAGGPHGATFVGDQLLRERPGLKARAREKLRQLLGA